MTEPIYNIKHLIQVLRKHHKLIRYPTDRFLTEMWQAVTILNNKMTTIIRYGDQNMSSNFEFTKFNIEITVQLCLELKNLTCCSIVSTSAMVTCPVSPTSRTGSPNRSASSTSTARRLMLYVQTICSNPDTWTHNKNTRQSRWNYSVI